ncbi:MAG: acetyl-CoA C-acyltransferase, partial [Candidatus Latescibacteria bacterium]|nr:acetyl-CoA C-acyltransferase [Candidatus Latescibacterota bacterium]
PEQTPAMAINKVCGSGLKAVMIASSMIKAGDAQILVAGGQESMSNVPYGLPTARAGMRLGHQEATDIMIKDGLWCFFNDCHMGNLAEYTAEKSGLSREDLDQFAYQSQMKAVKAQEEGRFDAEIVPVEVPQRKGDPVIVTQDETPRPDTTVEVLAKLRPAFQKDGMVTAGNAPGLNDAASALVVAAREAAEELGAPILARIIGYAQAAVVPKELFYAPVEAVKKLLGQLDMDINDFDLIEANEAFAAQALADGKELGWDWDRVNVNGGAIALGHPIGASGAKVLTTLIYALKDRGGSRGLATLCLGGGGAVALAVEVEN